MHELYRLLGYKWVKRCKTVRNNFSYSWAISIIKSDTRRALLSKLWLEHMETAILAIQKWTWAAYLKLRILWLSFYVKKLLRLNV